MAQHKNAKPKPKGWLMSVVEQIYKDGEARTKPCKYILNYKQYITHTGETIVRKMGRAEAIRKQSVPEIVFSYFFNKYGQKSVVNE